MDADVSLATPADGAWLARHDRHLPATQIERCIEAGEYLIAAREGARAGFLRFSWFWRTTPYMELILVLEGQRRAGVGTGLVRAWETAMIEAGATILMTSSMSDEPEPQAWHRRNGFRESGRLTFGRAQATPEVFFVKDLPRP